MKTARSLPWPVAALGIALLCWSDRSAGEDLPALSKDDGPFMVLARSFRGPQAEAFAKALAKELRKDYELPSFVHEVTGRNGIPEFRVLVGNCKTTKDSFQLMHRVKKIKPKALSIPPEYLGLVVGEQKALTRAVCTTNPLATIE